MTARPVRQALVAVLLLSVWESVVRIGAISPLVLPRPSAIAVTARANAEILVQGLASTVATALAGLALGFAFGLALVILLAKYQRLAEPLSALFSAYESLPKIALAPIFVLWFGVGPLFRVLLAASMTLYVFAVFAARIASLKSVPAVDMFRTMGGESWRIGIYVVSNLARPELGAAIRLAAPAALLGALIAEFVVASDGIGQLLNTALGGLQSDLAFACLFAIAGAGALLQLLGALVGGTAMSISDGR